MDDNYYNDELNFLLEGAKKVAVKCLKNFLKILGLNPEAFSHLYEINFDIDNTEDDYLACYNPDSNDILINYFYLTDVYMTLKSDCDSLVKNNNFYSLVVSIVHELLHANRTLMVEGGLNKLNYNSYKLMEIDTENCLDNDSNKYDFSLSQKLLEEVLGKNNFLSIHIPFRVIFYGNNIYTIESYNIETNCFEIFEKCFIYVNENDDIGDFLVRMGIELDNSNYSPIKIYKVDKSYLYRDVILCACDYYHPFSVGGKLDNNDYLYKIKIIRKIFLESVLEKDITQVMCQGALEEILCETFANMIVMSRNNCLLNLDSLVKKIMCSNAFYDEKIVANMIGSIGVDFIKWFFISSYMDCYDDKLARIFKEDYYNLLYYFYELYKFLQYDDEEYNKYYDSLEKIVKFNVKDNVAAINGIVEKNVKRKILI